MRCFSLLPCLLVFACPASAQTTERSAGRTPDATARPFTRRVLALYYPWYGTPQRSGKWLHQEGVDTAHKRIGSHTHYPALGPYDSTDPAVVDRHLEQAKAAGIDTLVCSWWGRDDPTDKALRMLLERAPAHGMAACVYWEQLAAPPGPVEASRELFYILTTLARLPGYLREGGRPVVFAYARVCQALRPGAWTALQREAAIWTRGQGVLIVGARTGSPGTSAAGGNAGWDAWHVLDAAREMVGLAPEAAAQVQQKTFSAPFAAARSERRLCVETLMPGHDDRQPNQALHIAGSALVERADGKLYAALWEQALKDDPDWVLINSFNQWHAGTEIEPSVEMGDRYLKLTAEYATRFKTTRN